MSALPPGIRPVQVPVTLWGVEARCDEARFPALLASALAAPDLSLPPLTVSDVRVNGPVNSLGGMLGLERTAFFQFSFTLGSAAPVDRDNLARAIARAIHASLTMHAVSNGFFSLPAPTIPTDGWTLYQRFLGTRTGLRDAYQSGSVRVGAVIHPDAPPAPAPQPAPTSAPATPQATGRSDTARHEWQLSRPEVTYYQTILYNLGALDRFSGVDGRIGPETHAAALEFQYVYNRRQNDPDAATRLWAPRNLTEDGIIGPQTRLALDNFATYRRDGSYNGWASLA